MDFNSLFPSRSFPKTLIYFFRSDPCGDAKHEVVILKGQMKMPLSDRMCLCNLDYVSEAVPLDTPYGARLLS